MELNAVQTRHFSKGNETALTSTKPSTETENVAAEPRIPAIITPIAALEILKSKPNHDELLKVLQWLLHPNQSFPYPSAPNPNTVTNPDLAFSGPLIGQIVNVLVKDILLTHWPPTQPDAEPNQQEDKIRSLLLKCLRSVPGLRALLNNLRRFLDQARDTKSARDANGTVQRIGQRLTLLIEVLERVLKGDGFLGGVWRDIHATDTTTKSHSSASDTDAETSNGDGGGKQAVSLLWKDVLALIKGGKLVSAVAEAERVDVELERNGGSWVGNGEKYGEWLGRNAWSMAVRGGDEEVKAAARVLEIGLMLGHKGFVIQAAFADVLTGDEEAVDKSKNLLSCLSGSAQRTVLYALIRLMDTRHLSSISSQSKDSDQRMVGAVAALMSNIMANVSTRNTIMIDWLVGLSPEAVRQSQMAHRAVVLFLAADKESLMTALSRALELFAQELFIKHTPIFQQEVNAQILLLLVGYLFRADKADMVKISKSSVYLNAISNHLASTSPRAHFLGMVVGTAVSDLVDSKENRMNFSSAEMEGADGQWYRNLTHVQDSFGSISQLGQQSSIQKRPNAKKMLAATATAMKKLKSDVPAKGSSKVISIEEINESTSEDDDMPSYAKPDSDPDDSDDDPELVRRKKPIAPVYIRDLLAGLRDLENYDSHRLALSTASSLIRRKASFGTEVTDNMRDLATLLTGLNDKYEMDSFQRWRLQGMIALLIADPKSMGPWFAQAFYNGEYSISQRASILSTLGLGARELAGLGKEDEAMTGWSSERQFPSKQLISDLHNHFTALPAPSPTTPAANKRAIPSTPSTETPIDALSQTLSQNLLQPLAAQAADTLTGPNALKVRTFSSRLSVRSRTPLPSSNALAKILADAFIFPLIGRWSGSSNVVTSQTSSSTGVAAGGATTTSPFLLSHLLRTLALILHAAGTTSPDLPRLTSEFWHLLLSVRSLAIELPVLEAVLFALLTLLEVNIARDARRVAEEHARELLETQAWVEGLFEVRIGGGGSEEDEKVRMVAAGVLMRCREVVGEWQRVLMGDLVGYT